MTILVTLVPLAAVAISMGIGAWLLLPAGPSLILFTWPGLAWLYFQIAISALTKGQRVPNDKQGSRAEVSERFADRLPLYSCEGPHTCPIHDCCRQPCMVPHSSRGGTCECVALTPILRR